MQRTRKQRPGRGHLIKGLMQLGASRRLAYNLSEDTMAMIKGTVGAMFADLKRSVMKRLDQQDEAIAELNKTVMAHLKGQDAKIEDLKDRLDSLTSAMEDLRSNVLGPYHDMVRSQTRFVWAVIGAAIVALFGLVATNALQTLAH